MSVAVNPCNLSISSKSVCRRILFQENFHGEAIKKILLKKGTNAAGKAGLELIFDGRDKCILISNITLDPYIRYQFHNHL